MTQQEVRPQNETQTQHDQANQAQTQGNGQEHASKWAVFLIVAIGVFMATLDSSIVNISLPSIARDFGVPLNGAIEWVIISYLVVTAAILLTAGRLADMIGRKAIWAIGLFIFTGGSALCGAATSLGFLVAARALQGLGGALLFAVSFLMPFYLEQLRGFPTQVVGLLLTPLPIMIAIVAPISGSLADRFGSTRWLASGGLAIACVGLILLSQLNAQSSIFDIIWRLVVTGLGQALFQSPNNSALLGSAPLQQRGSASGFLATGRVMGQSLSVALAGAIFASMGGSVAGLAIQKHYGNISALQQTFTTSFRTALLVCAFIAILGVFTSLVRGGGEKKKA